MLGARKPVRIRRILVAIKDVHNAPRSQLRKAASIARAARARVELFHAISEPVASDGLEQRLHKRLERLAQAPVFRGVQVNGVTSWDYPAHEAVIRRALVTKVDLVVAATQSHRAGARLLLTNTDWELVRQCPCLVLLAKSSRDYDRPAVIAAVDPFHAHAKPARLDSRIIDAAATFASRLRGELHAFHAYLPLTIIGPAPVGQPIAITVPPEFEDLHTDRIAGVFGDLAKKAGIPPARRHLHMGEVASELESVVKRTRAGIVVMGAVSRTGLRRVFIGSTAENVLDRLSCDLLVVKPQGFVTKVPRRVNARLAAR